MESHIFVPFGSMCVALMTDFFTSFISTLAPWMPPLVSCAEPDILKVQRKKAVEQLSRNRERG